MGDEVAPTLVENASIREISESSELRIEANSPKDQSSNNGSVELSSSRPEEKIVDFMTLLTPPISEMAKFTSIEQLYDDLRSKVADELRKVAALPPPKKEEKGGNWQKQPPPKAKAQKKKKKKRVPFEAPSGITVNPELGTFGASNVKSKDLMRMGLLLSGWGDPKALDAPDAEGTTPLMVAAASGRGDICDALIRKLANVKAKDNYGKTALHKAAANGYVDIVTLLLSAGAVINEQDKYGNTALHSAVRNNQRNVALQLIVAGIDSSLKNEKGESAVDRAKTQEFKHFVEVSIGKQRKPVPKKTIKVESKESTAPPLPTKPQTPSTPYRGNRPITPSTPKLEVTTPKASDTSRLASSSRSSINPEKKKQDELREREEKKKKMLEEEKEKRAAKLEEKKAKELEEKEERKRKEAEKKAKEAEAKLEAQRKAEEERYWNSTSDIAQGVKTWCSGVLDPMETGEFGPEKVVDGNPNTRWCGHPPEEAWIAFDFGEEREIAQVKIRFERAFAQVYRIELALDIPYEMNWFTAAHNTEGKQGWNIITLDKKPKARYLKIAEEKASVEGWGMSIWELEVLAPPIKRA